MSPRSVISASASMEISTELVSIRAVIRSATSLCLLSLPVRCSRSKPASPMTSVEMPPRVENAAVMSTVSTSSPAPPTRVSVVSGQSRSSAEMWSTRNFITSCARLSERPPEIEILSLPAPPAIDTSAAPRSMPKP